MSGLFKITASSTKKLKELCELTKEIWQEFYLNIFDKELLEYIFEFLKPNVIKDEINIDNANYYFINLDDENIGFIQTLHNDFGLILSRLYLKKEYRNKGVGQKIFMDIINTAKNNSVKKITTYVYKENLKTIKLFEKWGFVRQNEIVRYIGADYFIDEVEMVIEL